MSTPSHSSGADFAPGVLEALQAAQVDPAAQVVPAAGPVVRFLDGKVRSTTIDLDWPASVDGIDYRKIVLRRLTTAEVAEFVKSIEGKPDDATFAFPIFRRVEDDAVVPDAALNAFDDDDTTRLQAAALAFLPRRFGGAPASASIPDTGAPTAP